MNGYYDFGTNFGALVSVLGGLVIAAIIVGVVSYAVIRLRSDERKARKLDAELTASFPKDFQQALSNLKDIREKHVQANLPSTVRRISSVIDNATELMRRLQENGSSDQVITVSTEYENIFGKLANLLGDSYYLDIRRHENLWDDPAKRLREVETKLDDVNTQILENIRQVNGSRDLDFKVALDAITAKRETNLHEVFGVDENLDTINSGRTSKNNVAKEERD